MIIIRIKTWGTKPSMRLQSLVERSVKTVETVTWWETWIVQWFPFEGKRYVFLSLLIRSGMSYVLFFNKCIFGFAWFAVTEHAPISAIRLLGDSTRLISFASGFTIAWWDNTLTPPSAAQRGPATSARCISAKIGLLWALLLFWCFHFWNNVNPG